MADQHSNIDLHVGIIGGSGLGDRLLDEFADGGWEALHIDTPFGSPSGNIHSGTLPDGTSLSLLLRHGEGHVLNPSEVPYRANIFALKSIGVTHLIASGATGSLREDIHPGSVVLADQFIDKTQKRSSTFYENAAVHVEFAEPCCKVMHKWLIAASQSLDIQLHERGTYVCMEGPAFSTRAESELHRRLGGDLIGMTALPEAKLAREAEMGYALIALPTDYDCWKPHHAQSAATLLSEIIGNLNNATEVSVQLIRAALSDLGILRSHKCIAHDALRLAIWSNKSKIAPEEITRLSPLWGCHFK